MLEGNERIKPTETTQPEQRRDFLEQLRHQVDSAYEHRAILTWDQDLITTKESRERQGKLAEAMRGLPDEHTAEVSFEDKPSIAFVENPDDYRDLLQLAFDKLVSEGKYDEEWVEDDINEALEHELEHHIPALGVEGIKLRYGIEFFEDPSIQDIAVMPFVSVGGMVPLGIIRAMAHAPKQKSETDKILADE